MPDFYPYHFIQNCRDENNKYIENVRLYCFKSAKSKLRYLVRVEKYRHKVYVIKFYPKNTRRSPDRYKLLTNTFEPRRIIYTCINILKDIYISDPESSFAFVASNNTDEVKSNTKRYRVYKTIVNTQFGIDTFDHFYYEEKSAYLLLRKTQLVKNQNLISDIEEEFEAIYDFSE